MASDREGQPRHWVAMASLIALLAQALFNAGTKQAPAPTAPPILGNDTEAAAWTLPFSAHELERCRNDSADMFRFSFRGYMEHAFPRDDLRPLSCRGSDSQGGIALTLLDALDALVVFDDLPALRAAVAWIEAHPALFDVDARVHVFEVTIRALGGLLSAHALAAADPALVPGYGGALLRAAVDLGDRLMPAFDTPTGLPLSWVNLRRGRVPGDTRVTCTACAGTLLLELGFLSRLTGNGTYEARARHAVETIWAKRSARDLVGNTINVDTGRWVRRDAGVGAGVDSFYEYLLKSWLAFGEPAYLDMFARSYAAAQAHLALSPAVNGVGWLATAHMATGRLLHHYVSSLAAFWPGLQALAGQTPQGLALHRDWAAAWDQFGWLPESFTLNMQAAHPVMNSYPLRPELAESTFLLYAGSGRPELLAAAAGVARRLRGGTRGRCGHASVGHVGTSRLEDTMESFFLSETVKYLYFTFANATAVVDHYVLSTEGHLLPPFLPRSRAAGRREERAAAAAGGGGGAPPEVEACCAALCGGINGKASAAALRAALPRVPAGTAAPAHLRRRRCAACRAVGRAAAAARRRADELWRVNAESHPRAGRSHVAPPQWSQARVEAGLAPPSVVLCVLGDAGRGRLDCAMARRVPSAELTSQAVQALAQSAVFFQASNRSAEASPEAVAPGLVAVEMTEEAQPAGFDPDNGAPPTGDGGKPFSVTLPAMLAEFGPDLLPGCDGAGGAAGARARWEESVAEAAALAALDEEEVSEEGESEEEVRARIDAVQRGEMVLKNGSAVAYEPAPGAAKNADEADGAGTQEGGACGGGHGAAAEEEEDDDDPYVDPDYLDDTDEEESGGGGGEAGKRRRIVEMTTGELGDGAAGPGGGGSGGAGTDLVCQAEGRLTVASPPDACAPLTNPAAAMRGAIAVIHRGNCSFQGKVLAAQAAGAAGAVVVNGPDEVPSGEAGSTEPVGLLERGYMIPMGVEEGEEGAALPQPAIPAVMVRLADGAALEAAAREGWRARIWDPPGERKLEMARRVLEQAALAARPHAGGAEPQPAEGATMPGGSGGAGTCAAGPAEQRDACAAEEEGLAGPEAAAAAGGTGAGAGGQPYVQVELVVPPNSQAWLMHQVYQLRRDMIPAFRTAAALLVEDLRDKGRQAGD